jgi:hypothetical protein
MAATDNPLLVADFDFPPFDRVEPSHVRPGIRELLTRLVSHAFLHPDFHPLICLRFDGWIPRF